MPPKKKKTTAKKRATPTKKRKTTRKRKKKFSLKRWLLKWIFVAAIWVGMAITLLTVYYLHDLPDVSKLYEQNNTQNIKILDRDGNLITNIGNLYGDYVHFNQLPQHFVDAVLSTEDRRFFSHFGVDLIGLARAFYSNYKAGRVVQGGSTITQQLAKVVFLSPERKLKRKIQEVFLAIYLENNFTKQDIFTMYINRIYLGSGNYGVDAAARSYFGKNVADLSLYESAVLAGLIKAPSRYSPLNNSKLSQRRADQVLRNMVDNEKLSTDDIVTASYDYDLAFGEAKSKLPSPYFSNWIKGQLSDYISGNEIGDIVVKTTLDSKLQQLAEDALQRNLDNLPKENNAGQGAVLAISTDGAILAMAGGRSYSDSQFNRATQAYRQPGSAFKTFVYLAAMERGIDPDEVMDDAPVSIRGWKPENWNDKFIGDVSVRNAFAKSINTISIKLAAKVGIKAVEKAARKLGITSPINNDLSSALGTSEVNLLEITGAYAHFANYGRAVWTHGINEITVGGEVIHQRQEPTVMQVISHDATAKMNDLLVNVVKNGTGKRADFGASAGGKTGTSQNSRDAWFIGFTSDIVTGVWVGNDNNTPMHHVGGGGLPAIIWRDFMQEANAGRDLTDIPTTKYSVKKGPGFMSLWERIFGG